MILAEQIIDAAERIARHFKPQRIILFGSYAYGTPTEDSDIDLLVVMPYRGSSYRRASAIRGVLPMDIPIDVLVRSAGELSRRIELEDFFLREVTEKGTVLYEASDHRVGEQGRRRLRRRLTASTIAQAKSL